MEVILRARTLKACSLAEQTPEPAHSTGLAFIASWNECWTWIRRHVRVQLPYLAFEKIEALKEAFTPLRSHPGGGRDGTTAQGSARPPPGPSPPPWICFSFKGVNTTPSNAQLNFESFPFFMHKHTVGVCKNAGTLTLHSRTYAANHTHAPPRTPNRTDGQNSPWTVCKRFPDRPHGINNVESVSNGSYESNGSIMTNVSPASPTVKNGRR